MSVNDDTVRLRHMLDAAKKSLEFTKGRRLEDLEADEMLQLAVVRLLEVIGEAASGVSEAVREAHPELP